MNDSIAAQVQKITRELFGASDIEITDDTIASDVPGWDSLTHVMLITKIEKTFGIRFTLKEIQNISRFGDLVALVSSKCR